MSVTEKHVSVASLVYAFVNCVAEGAIAKKQPGIFEFHVDSGLINVQLAMRKFMRMCLEVFLGKIKSGLCFCELCDRG